MAAGLASPMIVHETGAFVLGQQRREQHVAALRAGRQPDSSSPRRRLTHQVLQCHGEVSVRTLLPLRTSSHHQLYAAPRWQPNETFVKPQRDIFHSNKEKIPTAEVTQCSMESLRHTKQDRRAFTRRFVVAI